MEGCGRSSQGVSAARQSGSTWSQKRQRVSSLARRREGAGRGGAGPMGAQRGAGAGVFSLGSCWRRAGGRPAGGRRAWGVASLRDAALRSGTGSRGARCWPRARPRFLLRWLVPAAARRTSGPRARAATARGTRRARAASCRRRAGTGRPPRRGKSSTRRAPASRLRPRACSAPAAPQPGAGRRLSRPSPWRLRNSNQPKDYCSGPRVLNCRGAGCRRR
jgi:hypothetical protein